MESVFESKTEKSKKVFVYYINDSRFGLTKNVLILQIFAIKFIRNMYNKRLYSN